MRWDGRDRINGADIVPPHDISCTVDPQIAWVDIQLQHHDVVMESQGSEFNYVKPVIVTYTALYLRAGAKRAVS